LDAPSISTWFVLLMPPDCLASCPLPPSSAALNPFLVFSLYKLPLTPACLTPLALVVNSDHDADVHAPSGIDERLQITVGNNMVGWMLQVTCFSGCTFPKLVGFIFHFFGKIFYAISAWVGGH
jgi:hypothetical protein